MASAKSARRNLPRDDPERMRIVLNSIEPVYFNEDEESFNVVLYELQVRL